MLSQLSGVQPTALEIRMAISAVTAFCVGVGANSLAQTPTAGYWPMPLAVEVRAALRLLRRHGYYCTQGA